MPATITGWMRWYAERPSRPGSSDLAIISAAAPALWSKYSHHSATEPANATTKDATLAAVTGFTSVSVAPMMTIDSPSAIKMNAWQRSAKWPPSMVQSEVRDRPRPGVAKPTTPPSRSTQTEPSHSRILVLPWARPPARASALLTTHQARIRWKLASSGCPRRAITMNRERPICWSA